MSDLKKQLKESGLIDSFGQPLNAGQVSADCIFCDSSCTACSTGCDLCTSCVGCVDDCTASCTSSCTLCTTSAESLC